MNLKRFQLVGLLVVLSLTACAPSDLDGVSPILLFNGSGTSSNDVQAVAAVIEARRLSYTTVDSTGLNAMSMSQLQAHRLLIIPGGNYIEIGNSLTPEATRNIQQAVREGLNYLGICAGALLAGDAPGNSLNLTAGVRFGFYAAVNGGIHKAPVIISGADGSKIEHYWEDGPEFTGWGMVLGRYPDGTPAIVEGTCGKGWVILSGVHPEAPEHWRRGMNFTTPASAANAHAGSLVEAALNGICLPHE